MGTKDKLIARLKQQPKDFTFDELETLLRYCGYVRDNKGRTSGSRVLFVHRFRKDRIILHKPHPNNILRLYQVKEITEHLEKEGLI